MKRAAVYARVSTDGQRDNYSIPTQVASCHEFAKQKGYAVIGDRYVDSITGFDAPAGNGAVPAYVDDFTSRELSRPSLDQAIFFLEQTGYDVLIVYSLDRLARDPYIRRTLELDFEQHGATVEYVQGNYDDTPEGEVRKDLEATFAKWENAKRVERSLRGMKHKAEQGLFVMGRPPFGYETDSNSFGGLALIEEQALVVQRIFHLYVIQEESIRSITSILSDENIENYSGKTNWAKSTIGNILKNTTYAGWCYFNKYKRKYNGRVLETRDKSEWIRIDTIPIVERRIFDAAQQRLAQNRLVNRGHRKRFYLLSGMVFCSACGRPYFGQTEPAGKNRRIRDAQYYRHRKKEGHCKNRHISANNLEPVVWTNILELLLDPRSLEDGYNNAKAQQASTVNRKQNQLETIRRNIVKQEEKRSNLTTAYVDPDINMTKLEYLQQREFIDVEINTAQEQADRIERELAEAPTVIGLESLILFASEISKLFEDGSELSPEEKRKILQMLHLKVFILEYDELRIEGWFDPISTSLSSTTPGHCGHRRPTLPWPASRVPGP